MASNPDQKRLNFEAFEPFDAHTRDYWQKVGTGFRTLLCEGIQAGSDKQGAGVAQDLNVQPSQFSEAIRGVNGRHFSALWVPRAMYADPLDRALAFLARLRNKRLVSIAPISPKQVAQLAVRTMLEDGAAGRALLEKAFGSDASAVIAATLGEEPSP